MPLLDDPVAEMLRRRRMLDEQMGEAPNLLRSSGLREPAGPPDRPEWREKRALRRARARARYQQREADLWLRGDPDLIHVVRVRGTTVFLPKSG